MTETINLELCKHCQKRIGSQPRGLCKACWNDRSIRERYPLLPKPKDQDTGPDWSLLKKPPVPEICRHQIKDGCCAICEREQRAKLARRRAQREEEQWDDEDYSDEEDA